MVVARYAWPLLTLVALTACHERPAPRLEPLPARVDAASDDARYEDAALEVARDAPLVLPESLSEEAINRFADASRPAIVDGGFVHDGEFVSLFVAEESRREDPTHTEPDELMIESFRDPRVLPQLARDPLFLTEQPGRPREDSALYCHFGVHQQSCSPNPCNEEEQIPCAARCGDQCSRCDQSCRPSCFACAASCTTDACRTHCAQQCALCLDGCRALRDRCASGECTRRSTACYERYERDFARLCRSACQRCYDRFPFDGEELSDQRRRRCVLRACGERLSTQCLYGGRPSDESE